MRSQQEGSCYYFKGQRTGLADIYKDFTFSFALQAFYEIFADHNRDAGFSSLDYVDMVRRDQMNDLSFFLFKECLPVVYSIYCSVWQLLYFAADPDPLDGVLRALSVAANQPMPSSKSLVHLPQPMTDDYGGDVSVPQIQVLDFML